jgi:hypothetical protein
MEVDMLPGRQPTPPGVCVDASDLDRPLAQVLNGDAGAILDRGTGLQDGLSTQQFQDPGQRAELRRKDWLFRLPPARKVRLDFKQMSSLETVILDDVADDPCLKVGEPDRYGVTTVFVRPEPPDATGRHPIRMLRLFIL